MAVTSPLGQDLPIQVKAGPDKETDLIEFTPTLPGNYKFKITYGGEEISGEDLTRNFLLFFRTCKGIYVTLFGQVRRCC